ncbi:acetyl-CoA carboxylase biotin carboxylase subunit [Pirellulimonas nuda]|uniref:acetyl-CoA carboxylase biotin carboxylase subunit n=1 Tax=Pirellulimonas nuda TaxID=2528009 RepID=UPI0011A507EE|nr:acetyl/propionyl/methylcrotonyl-CoA carboxylase subunit alpha [Pirellulimonas nuda]
MFTKILVANRGEIACRVIKTARKMGIATVAVYSEADKDALHVQMADEGVLIGPAPAAQSYLLAERIVEACQQTGAEAVHPGYGFLSENAEFSQRLAAAGIAFIGPGVRALKQMGDKIESKQIARDARVNTIPGSDEVLRDAERAVACARAIGYPVMLKASAGGGGKGMRVAYNDQECREGFERATGEARSSFGDDRVFVEKYITEPRHIEIQVLGDAHGNVVYLGERECSLQRRNQKVIEESPSVFLTPETRASMGEQAVALAKAVDYQSAGTVEFIVDGDRNFYFLEMNTRLQVEHAVTEYVTGLDLVELMIRVAAGERLPFTQAEVRCQGWAIEARIYAEDPARKFLPAVGRLVRFSPPAESDGVRVDTGVYEGAEVSIYYDPMIAKLITYGRDRTQCIARMAGALGEFHIQGVTHNIPFLQALVLHPRFAQGRISTNTIAEEYPDGYDPALQAPKDLTLLITAGGVIHRRYRERAVQITDQLPGYELAADESWMVLAGGERHPIVVEPTPDGYQVKHDGVTHRVTTDWHFGDALFRGRFNGEEVCIQVERRQLVYRLRYQGSQIDMMVLPERVAELYAWMPVKQAPNLDKHLLSPMPGLLMRLYAAAGDPVKAGQDLAVVEAMKMENVLRAEQDGVVSRVLAAVGDSLAVDQTILEFE